MGSRAERRSCRENIPAHSRTRRGVVKNARAGIARMRLIAAGQQHFAHHERAVLLGGVGINRDGFEDAVRAFALGLARGAAVKGPHREFFEFWEFREFLDLSFAADVGDGFVAIQPEVFQFIFCHGCECCCCCLCLRSPTQLRQRIWPNLRLDSFSRPNAKPQELCGAPEKSRFRRFWQGFSNRSIFSIAT